MKKRAFFVLAVVFVSLTLLLFLAGCKKKSTTPSSQDGSEQVLRTFTASPQSIQVGDTSFLSAEVTDQNYDPLANVSVSFSASPTSKGAFGSSSATTDSSGIASTYFVSSDTGTVTLTASISGSSLTEDLQISSTAVSSDSIASIELVSQGPSIQVKGTGGIESVILVATGYDEFGNAVGAGHEILFRIYNGPGGGENLENQTGDSVVTTTNGIGKAYATLNSGTVSGTVEIRAEADLIRSNATRVTIHAGPPVYMSLGADPLNIRGWDYVNVTSDIVAMVDDVYGNPVQDNIAVYFSTEEGMVDAYSLTSGGLAQSTYHSGASRNDGLAYIFGSTSGGTVADTIVIIVSGPPNTLTFLAYPLSLPADGVDKGDVIVRVVDVNGNFVVGGTQVEMKTDFGICPSGETEDGVNASLFETELTSQVLDKDYSPVSPDDGIGAVSNLNARADWASATVQVNFLTGFAYYKNCNVDITGNVGYGISEPLAVEIKDRAGNPLGGHSISVIVTSGSITGSPSITNSYGETTGLFFNAPTDTTIKSATITITDNDPRGGVTFNKKVTLSAALKKK